MSTYTLNNSAGDIDEALQKVVAVTTTPLDGNPNMVTSGGVKAYVDAQDTALETQLNNLSSIVTGFNIASLLDFPISVQSTSRVTSINVNVGTFLNQTTAVPLATVDYVTAALYFYNGNNDTTTCYGADIADLNAYSCVSARSVKTKTLGSNQDGFWYLHDIIILPTLGFSSGNYQAKFNITGSEDYYVRMDITGYIGKPA